MVYGWYHLFHGIREQRYFPYHYHGPSLYVSYSSYPTFLPHHFHTPLHPPLHPRNPKTNPPPPLAHRELAREKMWSRIHLIPALQAEEDRDLVRRHLADVQREKELLGDKGVKVYHSDRYVRPTFAITPGITKD